MEVGIDGQESIVAIVEQTAATRTGWRRLFLPVTYGYAALLISVTVLLSILSEATQTRVILHASTNLSNLLRGHFATLFSSAFVIDDLQSAAVIIPLLACLLALAELRFGALRLLRIFIVGHIGATVLVALGLWVAVSANWLPQEVTKVSDVGVSYGAMALIGAFIALVPSRWKPTWAITWLAVAVAGVAMGRTFTNVGHLLAFSIGLLAGYRVLRRGRAELPRLNTWEGGLLAAASALGYIMLVG
ncbi:rhomboid family intramembrane serine protease [Nocardia sp. NBC_01503]|uniref:rhomboid family intramembrane serine protease n=1 Tax=Nocardia sp. NBC_01503 TaxID=2975997 RepID=UPI002E7C45D4|nr:rhomboid family intramembrane serine protease [Nocardia sp. NBC_01503]WTL33612.1 rhomboid family intramembrane serine protease [Nocardia sp. NBC_01503]